MSAFAKRTKRGDRSDFCRAREACVRTVYSFPAQSNRSNFMTMKFLKIKTRSALFMFTAGQQNGAKSGREQQSVVFHFSFVYLFYIHFAFWMCDLLPTDAVRGGQRRRRRPEKTEIGPDCCDNLATVYANGGSELIKCRREILAHFSSHSLETIRCPFACKQRTFFIASDSAASRGGIARAIGTLPRSPEPTAQPSRTHAKKIELRILGCFRFFYSQLCYYSFFRVFARVFSLSRPVRFFSFSARGNERCGSLRTIIVHSIKNICRIHHLPFKAAQRTNSRE